MDAPRYGGFTLRTECNGCGQPVPLNAPQERAHCDACQKEIELPIAIWQIILEQLEDEHAMLADNSGISKNRDFGGFVVHYAFRRVLPQCEKCNHPFAVGNLPPGTARDFACTNCGDGYSTVPTPAWLRNLVPTATQIFSVDRGIAAALATGKGPPPVLADAPKPVVMACPQCGGSLNLTSEATRIIPCNYCKADVFLPDELWKRLHPTRIVREWYVRFEGMTRAQRDAEDKARRQAEKDAREAERAYESAQRTASNAAALDLEIAGLRRSGYVMAMVLWAVMLLTVGWLGIARAVLGVDRDVETNVGGVLAGISVVVLAITLYVASRPVKRRTSYDGSMMMFVVWFFAIFGLVMPVIGSIMCLAVAIKRFTGSLGGSTITTNGRSKSYPKIQMYQGETYPLGVAYLALALLWPAILLGFSH